MKIEKIFFKQNKKFFCDGTGIVNKSEKTDKSNKITTLFFKDKNYKI